jgi:hypothetical protein
VQGRSGTRVLYVEDLNVQPGDFITYSARARDTGRGRRSTEARSDIFFLEVKPFEEEFAAERSQGAGGGGGGRQLEELVAAQKEIIIATWKLDRRAVGGRSEQDVRAIARAQAELRTRVEQVLGSGRPPIQPRNRPPQQVRPMPVQAGGDDPMVRAVEAMKRAQAALESTRSGNGFGRQSQDLSALFDRELQRQQQTNYENRPTTQQKEQTEESDAVEKVRELARRQDELSRRQRDLANSKLSAEDLKRQLERLTREQTELRQQAEELSRQLAKQSQGSASQSGQSAQGQQQPTGQGRSQGASGSQAQPSSNPQGASQGSQAAGGGQSADGNTRMRDISEEMRSAASDLRRQDLTSASTSSGRAAQKLHDLERQLKDQSPEGRQRALGDLQFEARQIADEQRRIASEAERLGTGDAGEDARRRLAGEKDRLAERADNLERKARQLAGTGTADERGALNEAVAELQRQQVGRRMRESASALREAGEARKPGGQPQTGAAAERQLAQGLDRVADKLGAAAGLPGDADMRKLSEQLARTRDVRDRMAELERQMKDAETKQGRGTSRGPNGQKGQQSASGGGEGEMARLRDEYQRQLRQAQDLLDQMRRDNPQSGPGSSTPEQHEWSLSDPGTQGYKQDFSQWESLRKDVNLALERYESSLSQTLTEKLTRDRLNAGGSEGLPEAYRKLVAKYYASLARRK